MNWRGGSSHIYNLVCNSLVLLLLIQREKQLVHSKCKKKSEVLGNRALLIHQFLGDKDLHTMLKYNKGIFGERSFLLHLRVSCSETVSVLLSYISGFYCQKFRKLNYLAQILSTNAIYRIQFYHFHCEIHIKVRKALIQYNE